MEGSVVSPLITRNQKTYLFKQDQTICFIMNGIIKKFDDWHNLLDSSVWKLNIIKRKL